jgi:hypothetical protein
VQEQNKWYYDNGWSYKGEHFSAYLMEDFGRVESGKLIDYLVMLRDDKHPNKTIVLHRIDTNHYEIWSGFVSSQEDYEVMMSVINKFIEDYKNSSGAI